MATWHLTNRKEIERLEKATENYFTENLEAVESAGVVWEAYKGVR